MRVYWTIDSIPELQAYPLESRKHVWQECRIRALADPLVLLAALLCGVLGWLGREVSCDLSGSLWAQVVGIAVGVAIGSVVLHIVSTWRTRARIPQPTR
jgi:hypothetical protein